MKAAEIKTTNNLSSNHDANTNHHCLLLAGDIGGTNTRLALYEREQQQASGGNSIYDRPLFQQEYLNEDHIMVMEEENKQRDDATEEDGTATGFDEDHRNGEDNVKRFVRRILGPFLEKAFADDTAAVLFGSSKKTIENNANDNSNNVVIVGCLAVAGPVDPSSNNGTVTTSQREYWKGLNGNGIAKACRSASSGPISFVKACVVINDFVAQGYGCLSLSPKDSGGGLRQLYGDNSSPSLGPRFCVGAGTGFGSCYMVPVTTTNNSGTEYACFPSEYGQSDWAPVINNNNDDDQALLWEYLLQEKQKANNNGQGALHVSVENVVSGIGLATAYECLARRFPEKASARVREKFESSRDLRGRVVGEHANDCELCKRAVELILRAYGSVVGSCAMAFLPTGGLYVTGGLLLNLLESNAAATTKSNNNSDDCDDEATTTTLFSQPLLSLFVDAYRSKGAASFLLNDIPLYMVRAKDTGLRGAAVRAEMESKTFIALEKYHRQRERDDR